jgi:hypothetical protein
LEQPTAPVVLLMSLKRRSQAMANDNRNQNDKFNANEKRSPNEQRDPNERNAQHGSGNHGQTPDANKKSGNQPGQSGSMKR